MITRRDVKILLRQLDEQHEIIKRLEEKVNGIQKLLEVGGIGDHTSTDDFIKVF